MSIYVRLNTVIAALLILALAALVMVLLVEARPRILDENASMMSLTQEYVEASRAGILASADPEASLRQLVERLKSIRHIEVFLVPPGTAENGASEKVSQERDWLTKLVFGDTDRALVKIPFSGENADYGSIILAANPFDEMMEVRSAIDDILKAGLLLALAVFGLTSWIILRALRPVHELCGAIAKMEAGDYDIRLKVSGAPEINAVSRSVVRLASALRKAQLENARLSARLIRLQDDERRAIARELHDEVGPHLYAARVRGTSMKAELAKSTADRAAALQMAEKLLEEINALQSVNRRVLHQLAPAGLRELGLGPALQNLTARWREERPEIALELSFDLEGLTLDDTTQLTVYRIVQEGLTNAFRHAKQVSRILVTVSVISADGAGRDDPSAARAMIRTSVEDDGKTLSHPITFGYGLRGMQERVTALGGKVSFGTASLGGLYLEALLPLSLPE